MDHCDNTIIIKNYRRRGVIILQGIVKWFNNEKGFGFIEYENGKDVFVHYTAIKMNGYKTLNEGDLVRYELKVTDKGLQSTDVEVIKQAQVTK